MVFLLSGDICRYAVLMAWGTAAGVVARTPPAEHCGALISLKPVVGFGFDCRHQFGERYCRIEVNEHMDMIGDTIYGVKIAFLGDDDVDDGLVKIISEAVEEIRTAVFRCKDYLEKGIDFALNNDFMQI